MRLNFRETVLYGLLRIAKAMAGSAPPYDPNSVRRILVISSTALGDTVLSTAAMVALRRRFPQARIVGLIDAHYCPLFAPLPALDAVLPSYGGYRRFLRTVVALRREHFDLALILHGNEPQATPLAYLAGARHIFKLPNTNRFRFLLSNAEPVVAWSQLGHGIDQRLRVAELAGAACGDGRMQVPCPAAGRARVAAWLTAQGVAADAPLIGFQVGASSRSRRWPAEHFAELARHLLAAQPALRIVLTGSPGDAAACRQLAAQIGPATLSAAATLPLPDLPLLLQRLSCLVSGDTGTMHLAVAVGTPVVALFAGSDPKTSGPAYDLDHHQVIYKPCPDLGVSSKSDDQRGIARILPAEVMQALAPTLAPNLAATPGEPR